MIRNYKDLIVWQKAYKLCKEIYGLTKDFPKSEMYGLTSQIQRAAASIPSNIAEGHSRQHTGEFIQFAYIALGSSSELETQLMLVLDLKYIKNEEHHETARLLTEVRKMLNGLISSLRDKRLNYAKT